MGIDVAFVTKDKTDTQLPPHIGCAITHVTGKSLSSKTRRECYSLICRLTGINISSVACGEVLPRDELEYMCDSIRNPCDMETHETDTQDREILLHFLTYLIDNDIIIMVS